MSGGDRRRRTNSSFSLITLSVRRCLTFSVCIYTHRIHINIHSHPHTHSFSPSSVSKSVKQSSEPLVVMRISPLRVKIMDLSSMLIIQPTTSPACQHRPNKRLPMFRQWPYVHKNIFKIRAIKVSYSTCNTITDCYITFF